jgi:hypothetical protein
MWIAIGVLAAWMLVLSLLYAGLVRFVATLGLAREAGALPLLPIDFDADGPEIGASLPADVVNVFSGHGRSLNNSQVLLLFSPGCGTCLSVAEEVSQLPRTTTVGSVFLVVGPSVGDATDDLRRALKDCDGPVIDGADARTVMRALDINSVPFAVRVAEGRVVQKRFLRQGNSVADMFRAETILSSPRKAVMS